MISNFFCSGIIEYCETFKIAMVNNNTCLVLESIASIFCLSSIDYQEHSTLMTYGSIDRVGGIYYKEEPLANHHSQLLMKSEQVHNKAAAIGAKKVKIIPLALFSDDTSGNTTKKWNAYDSWIMTPAAMTLKERNMYENQFFLCTHHNPNAMETGSLLVNDLKSLEDGVLMFDLYHEEEVLVYAPLLFVIADNVRHSELCCNKGLRATCPCRKCYWQLDPSQARNEVIVPLHTSFSDYIATTRC